MSVACNDYANSKLAGSVTYLCAKQCFGFAQLDDAFCAVWRHGDLAGWITPGENVCAGTELFFGMERDFLNLQDEDGASLVLPRVGLPQLAGASNAKISVEVFWDDAVDCYHVVIHRLTGESEVELELLRQIRARRLAEQHVQTARAQLAERQMLLDVLMEEAPVALALFDADMRYLFATARWVQDFHLDGQPLIGRSHYDAMLLTPGDVRQKHKACLAGARPAQEISELGGGADASSRWVRWTHRPWLRTGGVVGGVLTTAEDLTASVAAQHNLERDNRRLRAANRELEQFSFIVVHDLKAPLRSLEFVVDKIEGQITATTSLRQHITRIRSVLIGANDYCKAGYRSDTSAHVDLARLVAEIAATQPNAGAFNIEVHADLPEFEAEVTLLDLVLRNLIGNAIAHHDRAAGQIAVFLRDDTDMWLLEVADDGPGIPPARHSAIFEPFTRFDGTHGGAGQGLGLAIVKRALDGIGASILVRSSAPDERGSCFSIRWPKRQFFHRNSP